MDRSGGAPRVLGRSLSAGSVRESASVSFSGTGTHNFLRARFQPGSAKNPKLTYNQSQKVFHSTSVPREVAEVRKAVTKQKRGNILGTEPAEWNISTVPQRHATDLRSQLIKVRAGFFDEPVFPLKAPKQHSDEQIESNRKFITALTGQTIGKCGGRWCNLVDERGLAKHCIRDDWPDWNNSTSCHTKEDIKQALGRFEDREQRRRFMADGHPKLDAAGYVSPAGSITNVNDRLRERKIDFQDLKDQFKAELRHEFPSASEERLQATAQRLLNEKLLAEEKMARFPVHNENFRPNINVTSQDRRFREFYHPGTWCYSEGEGRHAWSCCGNFGEASRGCEFRTVNPDAWCTLGFERARGQAAGTRCSISR